MASLSPSGWQIKFKTFVIGLVAISILFVSLGLVVFWRLMGGPLSFNQRADLSAPSAAVFVPRQAPMMASVLASPDQVFALQRTVASSSQRSQLQADWQNLKANLLAFSGLDFETDIRPWLEDEITFAVTDLDLDQNRQNGLQPGYLLAMKTQDGDLARESLELFWQRQALAGRELKFEMSNGVRIIATQSDVAPTALDDGDSTATSLSLPLQNRSLATAVVGNQFVLLANHPDVLQHSIRNAQAPDLNLKNRSDYQRSLERLKLESGPLGLTYLNLPQLVSGLGLAQPRSRQLVTSFLEGQFPPQFQTLMTSFNLSRQGLKLNMVFSSDAQLPFKPRVPDLSKPVDVLQQLPAETVFSAGGHDLERLWHDISSELAHYTRLPAVLTAGQARWRSVSNKTLMNQIQAWLTESYAMGCLPSGDWIFIADHTARSSPALEALDRLAEDQGLTVSPLTVGNQVATAWTQLKTKRSGQSGNRETTVETDILGIHTTVNQRDIFTTSLEAMVAALNAPRDPLVAERTFAKATSPLASPNTGQAYLNWSGVQPIFRSIPLLNLLETSLQPVFKYVDTVAVAGYGGTKSQRQGEILVRLSN